MSQPTLELQVMTCPQASYQFFISIFNVDGCDYYSETCFSLRLLHFMLVQISTAFLIWFIRGSSKCSISHINCGGWSDLSARKFLIDPFLFSFESNFLHRHICLQRICLGRKEKQNINMLKNSFALHQCCLHREKVCIYRDLQFHYFRVYLGCRLQCPQRFTVQELAKMVSMKAMQGSTSMLCLRFTNNMFVLCIMHPTTSCVLSMQHRSRKKTHVYSDLCLSILIL